MALACTWLGSVAEVRPWIPAWERLLPRTANDEPTLTPAWALAWWRAYGADEGRRLRVGLVMDGARLVGLAPLVARRVWRGRALPFRRLESLGAGEPPGDDVGGEYLGPIAERGAEDRVAIALAAALARGRAGAFDELVLPAMRGDVAMPSALACALRREGLATELVQTSEAPWVPLPADWDTYLAMLPSSGRYLVRRALRDVEAWAPDAHVERATSPARVHEGLRVLAELHAKRWAAAGQRGVFAGARFRAFHDDVAQTLFEEGRLDLAWLVARGRPIAAAYVIVHAGKASYYQGGRDTDVPAHLRPGIALHAHLLRSAIERGLVEYDFLGGAARYKRQLALATRPLLTLRAAQRTARERLLQVAVRVVGAARERRAALFSRYLPADA